MQTQLQPVTIHIRHCHLLSLLSLEADTCFIMVWNSGNGVGRIYVSYSVSGPIDTGMCAHLQTGKPPQYFTKPPGQLSLLPSVRQEMSTSQSAVMLCGWGVKVGIAHSTCG